MAAILGQVSFDGQPVAAERVQAALVNSLQKEGSRVLVAQGATACLAHRGGEGAQGAATRLSVVLDGDVHARDDLVQALGLGETRGSADLISESWKKWGMEAPGRLLGDFAVAIHDPDNRCVALLRDHVGTRPLHWHFADGVLSFATFIPDLLALLQERPGANETAVAAYLRWPTAIGRHTFLAGLHAVEPGHAVLVDASGAREVRWWRPEEAPEIRYSGPNEYGEAFRALTETAIADRLPSGRIVGAHLSGGIDSTTVALMATGALRARGRDLSAAYCWSPPISADAPELAPDDERLRVEAICDRWQLPVRYGVLTGADLRQFMKRPFELEGLADVSDEFPIMDQAEKDGTQVILSGWGGDEAFSSHVVGLPAWMLASGRLRSLLALARARGGFRRPDRMARFLWRSAIVPLLPDESFRRLGPYSRALERGAYPSADLARRLAPEDTFGRSRLTADPRRDLRDLLGLHHLGDRMATWAAWGAPREIEYRYPLTDRRIIEFVLGVPPEILWGDKHSRFLAREAASKYIAGRLTKSDPANERKRRNAFWECWRILGDEVRSGAFDEDCPWLDMPALRRDLGKVPESAEAMDVGAFARIYPAVRAWHMARRFGVTGQSDARLAG